MDEQIIKLCAAQQEAIALLSQQMIGITAAHQILLEILLSVSPQQKQAVTEAVSQILSRPELLPNHYAQDIFRNVLRASKKPSRTSPEGRRGWLHLVSPPDSDEPKQ